MKKLIYFASFIAVSSFITSCNKKDDPKPNPSVVTYTPEQNKANLQQTGLDVMKEIDEAKNMKVIHNVINFAELVDKDDPIENNTSSAFMPYVIVNALSNFHETGNVEVVYSAMKHSKSLKNDENLETVYTEAKGLYTWDGSLNKWVKTASNNIVFKFPALKGSIANNATYTIDYIPYTGKVAHTDLTGNMPSNLIAKLDIDNTNLLTFDMKATYDSEGIPTSIASNLKIENFKFALEMNASSTDINSKFSFTHNGKNIVAMGASSKGNFKKSNLETVEDNIQETEDINKLLTSMNGYFQVFNVKFEASANVQAFADDVRSKGGENNIKNDSEWTNLINKYLTTSVYYTDRNAKIGKGEMYMKPYTNTYTVWDYQTNKNVEKTESGEDMNVRIVFEDGSKIDLESYLDKGFDQLENEFEKFLNSMESNYDN
jgi:hypothetical protein